MTAARDLIVIGGGEHARVVIDAALSRPDEWAIVGYVDPRPCPKIEESFGVRRLGDDEVQLLALESYRSCAVVLGVGPLAFSEVRQSIVQKCRFATERWATIVHAKAWISAAASVGPGTVVFAGAAVNAGAKIESQCVINTAAVVEHDVSVGSFSHVGPAAAIGGATEIGDGCYLGLGCRVRDHVRIGRRVTVGMGAVVLNSVDDGLVVVGVPARVMKAGSSNA